MSANPSDPPHRQSENEILEDLKAEYVRVHGRRPRIGRTGGWVVIDYTPMRLQELQEMLKTLRAAPSAGGGEVERP